MRYVRFLLAVLVVLSGLNWGLPAGVVSGAPPSAQGAAAAAPGGRAAPASSATIQVTVEGDQNDDPGLPASAGSGCSLREALQLTFSDGNRGCGLSINGATNITIKMPPGDFVLTIADDLPPIAGDRVINISGPGVVIDGGSQGGRQNGIFHIVNGTLNLKDMTLQHGRRAGGGAVWLGIGALTANNVRFESNAADMGQFFVGTGGAILDDSGDVSVTNSLFVNNLAFYSGGAVAANTGYFFNDQFIGNRASDGGAFSLSSPNSSPLVISQSQFKGNLAQPQAALAPMPGYAPNGDLYGGGAIHNKGTLSITKTLFQNNQSVLAKGGGAFWNQGQAVINECVFTQNTAIAQGPVITSTWGGAIINYGDLQLVRCSIHENQADYAAAIFNHGGNVQIFNSTISNNSAAKSIGGIMNEHALFDGAASLGAQVHLTHVTIGLNAPSVRVVDALYDDSVWFSNSIINGSCSGLQYTVGHSVMAGICDTEQDPQTIPQGGADISATTQTPLHLQPLSAGNSTVPEFMLQKIASGSNAIGIGRDGPYGCGNAAINHRDQNLAPRQVPCDAGAYQAGGAAPLLKSTPAPGLIDFPLIDLSKGQSGSLATLLLSNIGNGALTYQIVDEGGSSAIVNDNGSTDQVTLFENQQSTITFSCNESSPGQYWHEVTVETDAPNQAQVDYQLRCDVVGDMGLPAMMQMPGPANMPMPLPGQTAHSGFDMNNPGHMPITVNGTLVMMGPPWMSTLSAPAGETPNSPATTLNPGQSLHIDVACQPTAPGVYLNTLRFTTSDPDNPIIQYNLACEEQVNSPPEALHTASASILSPAAHAYGVAVSPDGAQVLAGGGASETTLSAFVRDPSTGALTQNGWVALPGMSAIQSIKYSHDGQYVYYTSSEGNGLVAINSAGDSLGSSQVITSGTPDNTCYIGIFPYSCPNNVMYGADGLAVSPDDQFVYVVGYYDNSLTTFQRQPNGQLDLYQIITGTVNGLSGPVKVVTSPDGNDVYVASFNSSTVAVFQRTGAGVLGFQTVYQNGSGGLTNLGAPSDLAVSPDGNFVYIAASTSNAVDVFQRSSADGGLSLSSVITGVTGVWGLAITHDDAGRRLFLTQSTTNQVQVYGRDQSTGALSFVGANTVTDPVFVTSSPDDLDVYASLYSAQALQHFQTIENAPVLSHISPASALVGGSTFTLTAAGGRFYPNSQIVWNGTPQPTVFVSQHVLLASIPAGQIAAVGNPPVLVHNPAAPASGNSNSLTFAITSPAQPPVPSIASLDPPAASFGGGDLVVVVTGANFAPDAQVYYNHATVPTLFIDSQTLQITLSADILNTPGDGGLEVTNGGGAPALAAQSAGAPAGPAASKSSTVVSFKVNPPGVPAAPAVSRLAPASAVVSSTATIWVTVVGHNFSSAAATLSVGRWNGLARPTVVLDRQTLLLALTPPDLAAVGNGHISIYTPGVGASAALTFRVRAANEKPVPVVAGAGLRGRTLYVRGSDFVTGAQITINGVPRATTFVNQYELAAPLTLADRGMVIKVSNPGPGGGLSNALVAFFAQLFLPLVRR